MTNYKTFTLSMNNLIAETNDAYKFRINDDVIDNHFFHMWFNKKFTRIQVNKDNVSFINININITDQYEHFVEKINVNTLENEKFKINGNEIEDFIKEVLKNGNTKYYKDFK